MAERRGDGGGGRLLGEAAVRDGDGVDHDRAAGGALGGGAVDQMGAEGWIRGRAPLKLTRPYQGW